MDRLIRDALLDEYEIHSRVVKAAEQWSPFYKKAKEAHDQLIKAEAKIERVLRGHFKDLADQAERFVNWQEYYRIIRADYDVEVLVLDDAVNQADEVLFELLFDPVALAVAAGAQAGEHIYKIQLGLDTASAVIQRTALEEVADLVGKKVLFDGQVVDNDKPEYRISEATRKSIRQSIQVSIAMGEEQDKAMKRLRSVINNAKRAEMIAQTEAVNSYQRGMIVFGKQSGAVGKEWQISPQKVKDICSQFADYGSVPFKFEYKTRNRLIQGPTAHPRCRCGMRLIYQNELDENPELFSGNTG